MEECITDSLDSLLSNPQFTDLKFVDVVYGGAYSISNYYMESGNPRQMRGASQILLDLIQDSSDASSKEQTPPRSIYDCLSELSLPKDCVYFTSGSEFFAVLPEKQGELFTHSVEKLYRQYAMTVEAAVIYETVSVQDIKDDSSFKQLMQNLNISFTRRRMYKFSSESMPDKCAFIPEQPQKNDPKYIELDIPHGNRKRRCERCNTRDVSYRAKLGEVFYLCPSCAHKEFRGAYPMRNTYKIRCAEFGQKIGIILKTPNESLLNDPNWLGSTVDLADSNGDIALLYADINNLGGAGKDIGGGIRERKLFTEYVTKTIHESLYTALLKAIQYFYKKKGVNECSAQFEIIAAGGDDTCVIVPGEIGLMTGVLFLEEFGQRQQKQERPACLKDKLSISAGIALGHANTPLIYMRGAVEQLLSIAKKKSHQLSTRDSCLDIISLNSDGQWAVQIEDVLRKKLIKIEDAQTANLTLRPFTIQEARKFLEIVQCARNSKNLSASLLHTIAEASDKCGIEEGNLWFRYLLSRKENIELTGISYALFERVGDHYISRWRDLDELSGQIGGDVT